MASIEGLGCKGNMSGIKSCISGIWFWKVGGRNCGCCGCGWCGAGNGIEPQALSAAGRGKGIMLAFVGCTTILDVLSKLATPGHGKFQNLEVYNKIQIVFLTLLLRFRCQLDSWASASLFAFTKVHEVVWQNVFVWWKHAMIHNWFDVFSHKMAQDCICKHGNTESNCIDMI